MGVPITWLAPYKFNQRLPFDVDYKVMGTFTEFYISLLKFVNFKLFSDLGLSYPVQNFPMISENLPFLNCDSIRAMQKVARAKFSAAEDDIVDPEFANTPEMIQLNERLLRSRK